MTRFWRIWLIAFSSLGIVVYLLPIARGIASSLELSPHPRWSLDALSAFSDLESNDRLQRAVLRSLSVAAATSLLAVVISSLAVVAWLSSGVTLRRVLLTCFLLPLFVPETTHALAISGFFARLGIQAGALPTIAALVPVSVPPAALVLLLAALSIQPAIWRGSLDLGMTDWDMASLVIWPLLWPAFATATMFLFIAAFNEVSRTKYCAARELYSGYLTGNLASGGQPGVYAVATVMFLGGVASLSIMAVRMSHQRGTRASR